jgi:hypothetical protein
MKYKIAICKTYMIGSPALILGFCRYDDDDAFWQKFQLFTAEEYLNIRYEWKPPDQDEFTWSRFKNQEEADKETEIMRKYAQGLSKYHGDVVHFDSINKDVKIHKGGHDFNLGEAEPVEMTKDEWKLLGVELGKDQWMDFDLETWGK